VEGEVEPPLCSIALFKSVAFLAATGMPHCAVVASEVLAGAAPKLDLDKIR
jgi:hypothetical protein